MLTAEKLYEAYGKQTNFVNFLGQPMPAWNELPENIKAAWEAVYQEADKQCHQQFSEKLDGILTTYQALNAFMKGVKEITDYIVTENKEEKQRLEKLTENQDKNYRSGIVTILSLVQKITNRFRANDETNIPDDDLIAQLAEVEKRIKC